MVLAGGGARRRRVRNRRAPGLRALGALLAALGAAMSVAPPAFARHNLSMLRVLPELSAPGADVAVSGFSYTRPVSIHFKALDGPVLGTFTPDSNSDLRGTVTIPADTKPGAYLLFATQDEGGKPTRLPARALLTIAAGVGGAPLVTAAVAPEPRVPAVLREDESASAGSLVLAGFGGAGIAVLAVGAVVIFSRRSRRARRPSASARARP